MNTIASLASQHPFVLLAIYWLFNNFVSTMPSIDSGGWTSSIGYKWLFNFSHAMSGTVGRIMAQYPATSKFTGQQVITNEPPKPGV